MRRALPSTRRATAPLHPNVAVRLNNLAQLLADTDRLAEAEPLMRRALAIDEGSFGPDHPDVARDLNNLAVLLQATNRAGEAEPLMRRALAIDEAQLRPRTTTPWPATSTTWPRCCRPPNRPAEAEPLMRRVVGIYRDFTRRTGHEHPRLRAACEDCEALLRQLGRATAEIDAEVAPLRAAGS